MLLFIEMNLSQIKKEIRFNSEVNNYVNKIDNSIKNFRFNVAVASFYEIYNFFRMNLEGNLSNKIIKENLTKVMKQMIPSHQLHMSETFGL